MEWAIHIGGARDACERLNTGDLGSFEPSARLRPLVALAARTMEEYFGPVSFTRWVYGNEFCEHLIPSSGQLEDVLTAARERGIGVTLLTPYVSDAGIGVLRPLLELLNRDDDGSEVVFNDWGVLNLLRREFSRVVPVQGRLMNKSLRDPRITGVYASSDAPQAALVTLQRSNLDCTSYTRFLSNLGVAAVEMDNLPQGADFGFVDAGVRAAVYLPFGFISTSRICMAAGVARQKRDKFQPGAPCRHECQTHLLEYTYTNSPFGNRDQKFYLKGNTYFYTHTEAMLRTLFEQARAGLIARLVFQPRLPMMAS